MAGRYNLRSPAVKRLMKEAQELSEPTEQYHAQPLEDNIFEWHFTIRGPSDSDFDGGIYHGRITLPPEYPMKPPSIIFLTANGRFAKGVKICLSISKHHPESWQPSWSIRTALLAIIGFMPTPGHGAIGSLDYTPDEKKTLANRSLSHICESCGSVKDILLPPTASSEATREEMRSLAAQLSMHGEKKAPDSSQDKAADSSQSVSAESASGDSAVTSEPAANLPISPATAEPQVESAAPASESRRRNTKAPAPAASSRCSPAASSPTAPTPVTSAADRLLHYSMIVIAVIIALLVFRRIFNSKYLVGDDE